MKMRYLEILMMCFKEVSMDKRAFLLEILNQRLYKEKIISEDKYIRMQGEIRKKYHCKPTGTDNIIETTYTARNAMEGRK